MAPVTTPSLISDGSAAAPVRVPHHVQQWVVYSYILYSKFQNASIIVYLESPASLPSTASVSGSSSCSRNEWSRSKSTCRVPNLVSLSKKLITLAFTPARPLPYP